MCDVVYVLLVDRIERHVAAERQVAAAYHSSELPSFAEARAQFDESLVAEPKQVDPDRLALMTALGLGGTQ